MNSCCKIGFFVGVAVVFTLIGGCGQQPTPTPHTPATKDPAPGVLMARMNSAQKADFTKERMKRLQNGPGGQNATHGNMSAKALSMIMSRMPPEQQRAYIAKNHLPGPGTAPPQR